MATVRDFGDHDDLRRKLDVGLVALGVVVILFVVSLFFPSMA